MGTKRLSSDETVKIMSNLGEQLHAWQSGLDFRTHLGTLIFCLHTAALPCIKQLTIKSGFSVGRRQTSSQGCAVGHASSLPALEVRAFLWLGPSLLAALDRSKTLFCRPGQRHDRHAIQSPQASARQVTRDHKCRLVCQTVCPKTLIESACLQHQYRTLSNDRFR